MFGGEGEDGFKMRAGEVASTGIGGANLVCLAYMRGLNKENEYTLGNDDRCGVLVDEGLDMVQIYLPLLLWQQVIIPIFHMSRVRRDRIREPRAREEDVAPGLAEHRDDDVQRLARAIRQDDIVQRVLEPFVWCRVELRERGFGLGKAINGAVAIVFARV